MSVYTISPDLLRNIEKEEGIYFSDILFVFSQKSNPYKVTKDKLGVVIDSYRAIEVNKEFIKTWLDLMSYKPSPFEDIDVDLTKIDCEESKFLKICKETKSQNKIIYYSKQNIKKHQIAENSILYEGTAILLLDRDEAIIELNQKNFTGDTYINSQVAKNNSQISDSKN